MPIRKTTYLVGGKAVSLAYVAALADVHPEVADAQVCTLPVQASPPPDRQPRWSATHIRRLMGRDPAQADRVIKRIGYERVMRRLQAQGF